MLADLTAAVDELAEADPATLGDGDTVVALHRELERLGAVVSRASGAFDTGRSWEDDGARSAASWLASRCRLPIEAARRRIRRGRRLRALPAVTEAWLAGEINQDHVDALCRVHASLGSERLDPAAEQWLVARAGELSWRDFRRTLAYWVQAVDPDGAEADAQALHDARRLHVSESFQGVWFLDGLLDPIGGALVTEALSRIEDELFRSDWAEAKARTREDTRAGDLARRPAQRRADALVEMARRANAMPQGARLPEPLITVFVGYESFAGPLCELANGTVVTPGSLLRWLDQAWIERVVFDGPDRIVGLGHRRRLFTGAERRAIELRDRVCHHDTCDVPAARCEVDHVQTWSSGGATTVANGRLLCSYHHRRRHRSTRPPP